MTRKLLPDIAVFLFIVLFVYAALTKLLDYDKFAIQLGQSPMLTHHASIIAWAVPVSEFAAVCLLLLPATRSLGLYISLSLMIMFTTYITIITTYDDYVPCSCGGILESMGWYEHLVFNIAFALLAVAGILVVENHKVSAISS